VKSKNDLPSATASLLELRADCPRDVSCRRARWLPIRLDKDGKPTGKRLVNDERSERPRLPLHQVKLPTRSGNAVPEARAPASSSCIGMIRSH
jgi:hypothetical protein